MVLVPLGLTVPASVAVVAVMLLAVVVVTVGGPDGGAVIPVSGVVARPVAPRIGTSGLGR